MTKQRELMRAMMNKINFVYFFMMPTSGSPLSLSLLDLVLVLVNGSDEARAASTSLCITAIHCFTWNLKNLLTTS